MNANIQQSVHIIGSPYTCTFNTAVTLTQSSIFTVCAIQGQRNHTKMNAKVLNPLRLMLYVVKLMLFVQYYKKIVAWERDWIYMYGSTKLNCN